MKFDFVTLAITIPMALVVIAIGIFCMQKIRLKYVRAHSKRYVRLLEINHTYKAYTTQIPGNGRVLFISAKSLAQLRKMDMHGFLLDAIQSDRAYWDLVYMAHEEKSIATAHYEELWRTVIQLEELIPDKKWYIGQKGFSKAVDRLLTQEKLIIPTEFFWHWDATYTSPAGRNHYHIRFTADIGAVRKTIDESYEIEQRKPGRAYERSLMTRNLRFKILRRDSYRCQICGATQADGAKLHVDHKVPIAKGGKTQESNLWTLCSDCNLGKGTESLYSPASYQ